LFHFLLACWESLSKSRAAMSDSLDKSGLYKCCLPFYMLEGVIVLILYDVVDGTFSLVR
jgi:hypothetical protein